MNRGLRGRTKFGLVIFSLVALSGCKQIGTTYTSESISRSTRPTLSHPSLVV
ncbi:hypothetical protein B0H12DRAFT_1096244 [Mycena haematopus]|nr:hypothetical protein B0H12DRAFT_1096244 [Mycena haematopus]